MCVLIILPNRPGFNKIASIPIDMAQDTGQELE